MTLTEIDVIIPVYKPGNDFVTLLDKLHQQTIPVNKIILFNTEQKYWESLMDQNPRRKNYENVQVYHISKREFDHGRTRRDAVKKSKAPIFVMMTQDARPADEFLLERRIAPLQKGEAEVSYARQLPRREAGPVEKFTRQFNYPEESCIKSKKDIQTLGIKAFFCSNVCAAYRRDIYDELGGFLKHAIFNEDMVYAGNLVQHDYRIAYVAQSQVIHSHEYTNKEQFHRNFDVGVSQAEHPEIFASVPSESEGIKLVKMTASYLIREGHAGQIIPMIITSGYKFAGYRLGKKYQSLSHKRVLKYAMNKEYFKQKGY